jgi:hypothetical protein
MEGEMGWTCSDALKYTDISWRVILKWIINNWICMAGTWFARFAIRTSGVSECDSESWDCMKCRWFDWLKEYLLLKEDPAIYIPWNWLDGWLVGYRVYEASFLPTSNPACVAFVHACAMPRYYGFYQRRSGRCTNCKSGKKWRRKNKACHGYKLLFLEL